MKKLFLLFIVTLTVFYSYSQNASDYYIPLCVGNYVKFHSEDLVDRFAARTMVNSIDRIDDIEGISYYVENYYEYLDSTPQDTDLLFTFWLKKDIYGNILLRAFDFTGNGILDSAVVLSSAFDYFNLQLFTLGYSRSYEIMPGFSRTDSVVSINAAVDTFTGCLQIRSTIYYSDIVSQIEDTYYAANIGKIKIERLFPDEEIHVDYLVEYLADDCNSGISEPEDSDRGLSIYPNPATDRLNLQFSAPPREKLNFNIYSVTGSLVESGILEYGLTEICVANLDDGIYIIHLQGNETNYYEKIIVKK